MAIELTKEIGRRIITVTEDTRESWETKFLFKPLSIERGLNRKVVSPCMTLRRVASRNTVITE